MEREIVECPICFEIYKDPRVFMCGHTICKDCAKNSIKNEKISCPICRKAYHIKSVSNLTKNYNFSILTSEFVKLKSIQGTLSKNTENLLDENNELKLQVENLKGYLDISEAKTRLVENTLNRKILLQKTEIDSLKEKLEKATGILQKSNKDALHQSIILKLELKTESLKFKLQNLLEIIEKYLTDNNTPEFQELADFKSIMNCEAISYSILDPEYKYKDKPNFSENSKARNLSSTGPSDPNYLRNSRLNPNEFLSTYNPGESARLPNIYSRRMGTPSRQNPRRKNIFIDGT